MLAAVRPEQIPATTRAAGINTTKKQCFTGAAPPHSPIDSILRLMTVCRITGMILELPLLLHMHTYNGEFL